MLFTLHRPPVCYRPSYFSRALSATLLLLAFLVIVRAQSGGKYDAAGTGGNHTIQGRLYFPTQQKSDRPIKIKLESTNSSGLSTVADANGSFAFNNLEPGPYTVIVEAGNEYEPVREVVNIDKETSKTSPRLITVPIYLRLKRTGSAAADSSAFIVDASLASVPEDARKLYEKALASGRAGNSQEAIEQLKKAVALYPNFPLALNELGVQYLKLAQLNQAIDALRAARTIAPEAFSPRLNYGIALLQKKQFAEAETELRQALRKKESSPTAHLYLGLTLIQLKRLEEAEKELQRAIKLGDEEVSLAHYYLGGIYWGWSKYQAAADELEIYLRLTPQAANAEQVRQTIKELRSKH